ncbi:hypothetical protein FO519_009986, partial [Halicephalobus sp. NKZ332]
MAEQAAIATAQHAHKTRFGGSRAHLPSTTTVIAFPSHEFDTKFSGSSEKEHQARLPGTHYGYVIRLGPGGTFINSQPIEVTSASFGMREDEAGHFAGTGEIQNIDQLPSHAPVT